MQQKSAPGRTSRLSWTTDVISTGTGRPGTNPAASRSSNTDAPSNPARSARRSCSCTCPPYPLCDVRLERVPGGFAAFRGRFPGGPVPPAARPTTTAWRPLGAPDPPVGPVAPVGPVVSGGTTGTAGAVEPVEPVGPVAPVGPVGPVGPDATVADPGAATAGCVAASALACAAAATAGSVHVVPDAAA